MVPSWCKVPGQLCYLYSSEAQFSDIGVPTYYFICGYILTIPPPHAHAPPLLPSGQHPPCPLATTIGGGTPLLDHGHAAATPKIGARQRRLGHDHCVGTPPLKEEIKK